MLAASRFPGAGLGGSWGGEGRGEAAAGGCAELEVRRKVYWISSALKGKPVNVCAIIRLITLSALGHGLDLTEIRNWKLLSQYRAINLCRLAATAAPETMSALTQAKARGDGDQKASRPSSRVLSPSFPRRTPRSASGPS